MYEFTINELQINYKWTMNGLLTHGRKSIHHMIMFNVGIYDS
jgi:hypothetical protein